jgi:hypothetical protein
MSSWDIIHKVKSSKNKIAKIKAIQGIIPQDNNYNPTTLSPVTTDHNPWEHYSPE